MSDRPDAGGVGARLKRVREGNRITLREIANTTKIAVPALDAIERDDVKKLPGGIFGRSFVRAYATELGVDAETAVAEFFAQFPEPADFFAASSAESDNSAMSLRLPTGALRAMVVAIPAVALLAWMAIDAKWRPRGEPAPLAAERIAAVRPEVPPPSTSRALPDAVPAGGTLPHSDEVASALTLHVSTRAECWVSITADGREVVSRLMGVGEEEAVRADSELRIKLGDASAVGLRLNGAPVRPLGRAGQVVTLRIDATNAAGLLQAH